MVKIPDDLSAQLKEQFPNTFLLKDLTVEFPKKNGLRGQILSYCLPTDLAAHIDVLAWQGDAHGFYP